MKLNNQIKGFFLLVFFFLASLGSFAGNNEDEWRERLVKEITAQLKEQMRQNAIHESKGESYRNNYVVSINQTRDWKQKFDWVDERGFEQNKMFRDEELEAFNTRLLDVNSNGTLVDTKTALYVVVVNEWELLLETTITPFETITTLNQLGSRAREEAFNALKNKMATVSAAVENEIESAKGLNTIYVHLMANIRVYDQPDVAKNKVTPKQFTVVPVSLQIRS